MKLNDTPLKFVKTTKYLGFNFSSNGNTQNIISDRVLKANRVGHMVLQALSTDKNVSTDLVMNMFDKQISPILLYGCSVWGVSKTHNLIYLNGQNEQGNTRSIVSSVLARVMNKNVPFEYARRVGTRTNSEHPRKILIKLKYLSDKLDLLRTNSHNLQFENFEEKDDTIEKVQTDFCKFKLIFVKKH